MERSAATERIAELEGDLRRAAAFEAETTRRLKAVRERRRALDGELGEARADASRVALEIIAHARSAVSAPSTDRLKALEDEQRALRDRLQTTMALCRDLVATLELVAEISTKELAVASDPASRLNFEQPGQPVLEGSTTEIAGRDLPLDPDVTEPARAREDLRGDAKESAASRSRNAGVEQDQPTPSDESPTDRTDDEAVELTFIIDDRDAADRRSSHRRWLTFSREDREYKEKRARHDAAITERFSRVLSSGSGVDGADPEEVEARIRNLTHGTNGV